MFEHVQKKTCLDMFKTETCLDMFQINVEIMQENFVWISSNMFGHVVKKNFGNKANICSISINFKITSSNQTILFTTVCKVNTLSLAENQADGLSEGEKASVSCVALNDDDA